MENYKKNIAEILVYGFPGKLDEVQALIIDRILYKIEYEWDAREDIHVFGEPTEDFILDCIEKMDFEGEGYNVERLKELFGKPDPTEHERFESLLNEANITRHDLAEHLGLAYGSVQNQLAPSKELPRWAKSVLYVCDRLKKKNVEQI